MDGMKEQEIKVHEFMVESWLNTADDFRKPEMLADSQRRRVMIRRCQDSAYKHALWAQELRS